MVKENKQSEDKENKYPQLQNKNTMRKKVIKTRRKSKRTQN